jgi:acetyltransferase-like isoleucine patch superfamily enzyme
MKSSIKGLLNLFGKILVSPFALCCWLEKKFLTDSEGVFLFFAHLVALLPGMPGVFLRRAYYALTLDHCSDHCHIGFGSLFTHRDVIVEDYVYIGAYSMIGSSQIGARTLIGSRVSILSGKSLHVREADGTWSAFDPSRMVQVRIAPNVWIGEGAIIMADIGGGSMIGAGSVVNSNIKENIIVAGNPARFVRNIEDESPAKV